MGLLEKMIETKRCILRLPRNDETQKLLEFYKSNQDHLAPWDPIMPNNFLTLDYWENKISEYHNEYEKQQTLRFHIFLKESDELIGMANFSRIVRGVFHCCGLGYRISAKYEGQGLMSESLRGAINHIFDELNFHRIEANFIPSNIRSENLLRKIGFIKEGYAKDYLLIAGKWQDHVLNSLTNDNWTPM